MKKATREQSKEHNKRLILKTIYDQGEISRAEIARFTQLTRTTVSGVVSELIHEGLVREIGRGHSEGGKPPILLSVVDDSRHLIGIDLAESEFRGGVADLRGRVISRVKIPVDNRDGRGTLELVYQLIDRLLAAATSPLLGIGIGTPGLMDARHGIVRAAINLDWQDLPLREILEERYHLNVYIANDCQVAALGEYTFRDKRGVSNMIVVKVGSGIGAGIVLNGQLYYGDGFGAGEIGHIRIEENGEPCICGHAGCLETVVGSKAIIRRAREIARDDPQSSLHRYATTQESISIDTVLQAFEAGDAGMQKLVTNVGCYIGMALAHLVGALNVHHIVIGGKIALFGEPLLKPIRRVMKQRAMAILIDKTDVSISNLGEDIVIQGAAASLLAHELGVV